MRKYVVALVATLATTLAVTGIAQAQSIQSVTAKVTPTKRDKKKFKPAQIVVLVSTQNNDENTAFEQPPKAERTIVSFSKNEKFNTKAVPQCKVTNAQITNVSGDQAKQACGPKSKVSVDKGSFATIGVDLIPNAPGGTAVIDVKVTAFNGKEKNSLYLHSDPQGVQTKPVLVGKLKKASGKYGSKLDVKIPPLQAGGIADFQTTVKAKNYVTSRCQDKTPDYAAQTFFVNDPNFGHSPTFDTYKDSCKQKKSKKGKGGKKGGKGGKR